jgi:hypothetical protein
MGTSFGLDDFERQPRGTALQRVPGREIVLRPRHGVGTMQEEKLRPLRTPLYLPSGTSGLNQFLR